MVVSELRDALNAISVEIQQLQKDSNEKLNTIEELQKQQVALGKFRADLNNPKSQIMLQINSIFEDARNEVQNIISHDGTLLTSTEFDALLESERGLENEGKWFVAQINDKLQKLSRRVDNRIESTFEEISNRIEKEITNVMDSEAFLVSGRHNNRNVFHCGSKFYLK